MFQANLTCAAAAVALLSRLAASQSSSSLPTVDLGYQIQQATLLNVCLCLSSHGTSFAN